MNRMSPPKVAMGIERGKQAVSILRDAATPKPQEEPSEDGQASDSRIEAPGVMDIPPFPRHLWPYVGATRRKRLST